MGATLSCRLTTVSEHTARCRPTPLLPSFPPTLLTAFPSRSSDAVNGNSRSVTLRNHPPEEILRQAVYLRSATGRKASLQVKQRTKTQTPSIQGHWTPQLQDILRGKASPSS